MDKILFLDRDGVVNIDYGHVGTIDRFEFIPKIFNLCKSAQSNKYKIIIITNQAGIAKEKYKLLDFIKLSNYLINEFKKECIKIEAIYFCPYHEEAKNKTYLINEELQRENKVSTDTEMIRVGNCEVHSSKYRKPHKGMLFQACARFFADINKSILIGDNVTDIEMGLSAGIKNNILIGNYKIADLKLDKKYIKIFRKLPENILELVTTLLDLNKVEKIYYNNVITKL
jgi:D-glycero-D-manno-heptose 1,7-bisphosphate phosphatase